MGSTFFGGFFCFCFFLLGVSTCFSAADEEVRAEFFMEELNNGVKLCKLIGALQTKIAQSCPSAVHQVSPAGGQKVEGRPEGRLCTKTLRLRIGLGAVL